MSYKGLSFYFVVGGMMVLLAGCSEKPEQHASEPPSVVVAQSEGQPSVRHPRKKHHSKKEDENRKSEAQQNQVAQANAGDNLKPTGKIASTTTEEAKTSETRPDETADAEKKSAVSMADAVTEVGSPDETPDQSSLETKSPKVESSGQETQNLPGNRGKVAAQQSPQNSSSSQTASVHPGSSERAVKPASDDVPILRSSRRRRESSNGSARLALIIDDIGMSTAQLSPFLNLDADLTFSIIPETRQARRCLGLIRSKGRLPMLHLPMESFHRKDLLPAGAITLDLKDDEIESRVSKYLGELKGVEGVNNHMGSRATQDERVMGDVLKVVKERGLFFVDSKTSQETVVAKVADELGVPHAARTGEFLDDGGNTSRAYQILLDLGKEAMRYGSAIGIGHPHPGTLRAIAQALPELEAMGVQVVPVSQLTH